MFGKYFAEEELRTLSERISISSQRHMKKLTLKLTLHITAAAAKSLQPCLILCEPIDGSPTGSSVPGILQARILEWVAISFSNA